MPKAHVLEEELVAVGHTMTGNKDLHIVFQGSEAYTDGATIVYPSLDHNVDLNNHQMRVARGYAVHEEGHIEHSDLNLLDAAVKDRKRVGYKEALNVVEDIRIERLQQEKYPGAFQNLNSLNAEIMAQGIKEVDNMIERAKETGRPRVILLPAATLAVAHRDHLGYESEHLQPFIDKLPASIVEVAKSIADAAYSADSTEDIVTVADILIDEMEKTEIDGDPGSFTRSPIEGTPATTFRDNPNRNGTDPRIGDHGEFMDAEPHMLRVRLEETLALGDKNAYRPWTTQHDRVFYADDGQKHGFRGNVRNYTTVSREIAGQTNVVARKLERMLHAKWDRHYRGGFTSGPRLDPRSKVRAYRGHEAVWQRRDGGQDMNSAVTVLVDLSGSMHGMQAHMAARSAICLSEALERVNVPYEVLGFNSYGGTDYHVDRSGFQWSRLSKLSHFVFKDFKDKMTRSRAGLGAIEHCVRGDNADGEAVEWAARRLMKRGEHQKVLLVLSDGEPATGTFRDRNHLEQHLRDTVAWCEANGVVTIGIGICTSAPKRYYPRFAICNNLEDLGMSVIDRVGKVITMSAGAGGDAMNAGGTRRIRK